MAHVPGAGFVVNDACRHEQGRFECRVVQDVKNGRHSGQGRAQPNQEGDQAQVADGGVSKQALEVVLEDGNKGGKGQRQQARTGNQNEKQLGAANHGREASQ